jgi:MOSC domain-containing protein YiiM
MRPNATPLSSWAALRLCSRIDIGDVPLLISAHAITCAKNAEWFADRDFNRIRHTTNPGLRRLCAIPLGVGTVAVGDTVAVESRACALPKEVHTQICSWAALNTRADSRAGRGPTASRRNLRWRCVCEPCVCEPCR